MSIKKSNDYFLMLSELSKFSCSSAVLLDNTLNDFDKISLEEKINEMHAIEHNADLKKHEMREKLIREFITPIDRGDILELSHQIDNVTDAIEDILVKMYMYNISTMKDEALEFSKLIVKITNLLYELLLEFRNFKKSTKINKLITEVNTLEEEGDRLYTKGIRKLFSSSKDPVELLSWKDTFEYFEKCCDACEHTANVIESVIMKNS